MNNRYLYHYCARYQCIDKSIAYIDGIAKLEDRVVAMDGYRDLKLLIEPEHHNRLTIVSLSFLGMESDPLVINKKDSK